MPPTNRDGRHKGEIYKERFSVLGERERHPDRKTGERERRMRETGKAQKNARNWHTHGVL